MKTTAYNTGKEIRSRIGLVIILIVAILSTVRINEFYLNKRQLASENKTPQLKSEPVAIVSLPILNSEMISDPILKVEKWMMIESYWTGQQISSDEVIEDEVPLKIESWMNDPQYWGIKK